MNRLIEDHYQGQNNQEVNYEYSQSESFEEFVKTFTSDLADFLIQKNKSYGSSVFDPVRIFSKADAIEQINIRIDDKLSRIKRGNNSFNEDTNKDLIGYLIIKEYAEKLK